MLRVQKNLVSHLLRQGFNNNGLFSPIEIIFMEQVNKARSKRARVESCDRMSQYLIGQAISGDNYFTKWTSTSTLYVTLKPEHVLVEDAKGIQPNEYPKKIFYSNLDFYDKSELLEEYAEYDWPTIIYKIIKHDPVRDFIKQEYKVKFNTTFEKVEQNLLLEKVDQNSFTS